MRKIFSFAKIIFVLFFVISTILLGFAPYQEVSATDDGQTVSLTVSDRITITVDETSALGNLTPGTPIYDDVTTTVATNSSDGWTLSFKRDDATSTMDGTSEAVIDFPDATAWDSDTPNSSLTPGSNLSFRVKQSGTDAGLYNSTWWGANDTETTGAKYAGTTSVSETIVTIASYVETDQTIILRWRADAPTTQKAIAYDGTVTLTAIVNP